MLKVIRHMLMPELLIPAGETPGFGVPEVTLYAITKHLPGWLSRAYADNRTGMTLVFKTRHHAHAFTECLNLNWKGTGDRWSYHQFGVLSSGRLVRLEGFNPCIMSAHHNIATLHHDATLRLECQEFLGKCLDHAERRAELAIA